MVDLTENVGSAGTSYGAKLQHFEKIVDCADVNLAIAAHELFDVPKYLVHFSTYVEPLTLEGGAAEVDIGVTGGDVDSLIDGADVNAATIVRSGDAGTAEVLSMQGAEAGEMLLVDTTFSILPSAILDTAVFRVVSVWIDMRGLLKDPT